MWKKKSSCVGIYILDSSEHFKKAANNIKLFLESECEVKNYCLKVKHCISPSITKIASQMQQNNHNYPKHAFDKRSGTVDILSIPVADLHSIAKKKHYDVAIILGHSSPYNIGKFSTLDVMKIFIHPPQPTIVAILGCCGGNSRFGPLFKLFHDHDQKIQTIFGFYQRMVSLDELIETSLILGIQNYLCFSKQYRYLELRTIVKQAFVCGILDAPSSDPTAFANDSDEAVTLQSFRQALDIKKEEIPVSCRMLATYHIYTKANERNIGQFLQQIRSLQEVDEKCKDECERRNLHIIIPKVIEITDYLYNMANNELDTLPQTILDELDGVYTLQEGTINYLKDGNWSHVNDVQLFLAILQGYWGKNSYSDIRDYAYSRLQDMKKHCIVYELCAVAFCLLCEDSYLSVDPSGQFLEVSCQHARVWSFNEKKLKKLDLDSQVHLPLTKLVENYNWVKMFSYCTTNQEFYRIVNTNYTVSIRNYTYKYVKQKVEYFQYDNNDFQKAMLALQRYLFQSHNTTSTNENYHVKKFENANNIGKGHMMCFPYVHHVEFAESRIINEEFTKETKNRDPGAVSYCRFVYAYAKKGNEYNGILFLTTSHYGWSLVPPNILDQILSDYPWYFKMNKKPASQWNYEQKFEKFCNKYNIFGMQSKVIHFFCLSAKSDGEFPFEELGMLKMTTNTKEFVLTFPQGVEYDYNIALMNYTAE